MIYLQKKSISTSDEEERFALKLSEICSNAKLDVNQIQITFVFLNALNALLTVLKSEDKLWLFIKSKPFFNLLVQHTSFACQLLNNQNNQKMNWKQIKIY